MPLAMKYRPKDAYSTQVGGELASSRMLQLIDALKEQHAIQTPQVLAAFQSVPRHVFVPEASLDEAYSDRGVRVWRADGSVATTVPTIPTIEGGPNARAPRA
jgi:protein-L-isoaspartate(D-aspartate) O-methyltransferase